MILFLISLIFIGLLTLCFWQWSYFIRKGFKGPRGVPIFGMLLETLDHYNPPFLKIKEWTKKYGPVYGYMEGPQKTMVISEPEMVNEIFVKQFDNFYGRKLRPILGNPEKDKRINMFAAQGHRWKRLRTMSSPSFSNNSLKKVKNTVQDCGAEILWNIERTLEKNKGEEIDMLKFYQEYTLGVISRVALGQTEAKMFENPLLPKVRNIFNGNAKVLLLTGIFTPLVPLLRFMNSHMPVDFVPAFVLFKIIQEAVTARMGQRESDEKNGIELGEPQDFIDLFLDARADTDYFGETNDDFTKSQSLKVTRQLTLDEIVGQCFVFLVAGFDTTAISMAFATYCLATNPEVQKRLQEEIDRECPDPEITFEQLSRLKYFETVMKETLRLYPLGVTANTRKCMRETVVNGITFEEGVNVQVDTWTLHHDKKIWGDDADEFNPDRWLKPETEHLEHSGAYIPFGSGPRQCIGMRLAQMEQKILLVQILRQYSFRTTQKTQVPAKLVGKITVSPETVLVCLEPRNL